MKFEEVLKKLASLFGKFMKLKEKDKDMSYVHNKKHSHKLYLIEIIKCLKNNMYWSMHEGTICHGTLRNKHSYYVKNNIYYEFYKYILNKYRKAPKILKLSIDSTFISNKQCPGLKNMPKYSNKKGVKIHTIVDNFGVPLSLLITKGNVNDSVTFNELYNNLLPTTNTTRKYFLGDKGYDSINIRNKLKNDNYVVLIDANKRNKIDSTRVLNNKKLIKKYKHIYKKRIKVENFFSWLKQFTRMNHMCDRSLEILNGSVHIISTFITFRKYN
jgi:transposase